MTGRLRWWLLRPAAVAAVSAVTLAGCARSGAESEVDEPSAEYLVITGGWVFSGNGDEFERNRGILIRDSVIVAMQLDEDQANMAGARVIELDDGDYIVPGFFDLHAHYAVDLLGNGRVDETNAYPQIFLGNGVTSTFPAGEVNPERMRATRIAIDAGERPGPRIYNSGPYYGSAREGWDAAAISRDSLRAEVAYWVGQGARGFKAKGIDPDHLQWLIEAAHEHGLTVTGHLDSGFRGSVNPRDAIRMGIDRIEHFMGGDAMPATRSAYASLVEMTPDMAEFQGIIDLFKSEGVFYDATRSAYGYYGAREAEVYDYFAPEMDFLTPYTRAHIEARLPRRVNDTFETIYWVKRDLIEEFYSQGGGEWITLGTDHPSWGEFFSGFGVHREMHALNKSGIPAADVLRIATINGARALGVNDRLGTLEDGKLADLVMLSGNPLEDIRNTRHVRIVVRNGVVYDASELLESAKGRIGPKDQADEVNW
jgi:imidazolonepropionase-like amidohydrolase